MAVGIVLQSLLKLIMYVDAFIDGEVAEEDTRIGMVKEIVYLVGLKLVEDGHRHCSIGHGSHKCHSPLRTVFATQCNLFFFVYSGVLKQKVKLCYFSRYVAILQ